MTTGPDRRTCVLLVEDDANIIDLIRSNLVARGFAVVVSRDGADALAILRDQQPDIVLLDLMLPRVDGFALLRELVLHRGHLVSHATLLRRVWGPGYATHTEYTRVYMRRLRAKLETPGGPALIVTEPRSGYRLV